VEAKILEEIKENFGTINIEKKLGIDELKKLVYLHGAICEALRLFPPIPFERKQAIKGDILPSGHIVNPNTIILFFLYSMGRFEEIWGKDCLEFKPEEVDI
jgi:cytochrome P450